MAEEGIRYVLITNCTRGSIGSSLALAFATHPNTEVFATASSPALLAHLTSIPHINPLELDTCSTSSVTAAAHAVAERTGGRLDVLVNHSAIGGQGPVLDLSLDAARAAFDSNVLGLLAVTQGMVQLLRSSKRAIVVNIGSISAEACFAWSEPYGMTKAALHRLTRSLRVELSPFSIRVCLVVLGAVSNEAHMTANLNTTLPSTSLYLPIQADITKALSNEEINRFSVPPEGVAKTIVESCLESRALKEEVWVGGMTTVVGWLKWAGLLGWFESLADRERGPRRLREILEAQKNSKDGKGE